MKWKPSSPSLDRKHLLCLLERHLNHLFQMSPSTLPRSSPTFLLSNQRHLLLLSLQRKKRRSHPSSQLNLLPKRSPSQRKVARSKRQLRRKWLRPPPRSVLFTRAKRIGRESGSSRLKETLLVQVKLNLILQVRLKRELLRNQRVKVMLHEQLVHSLPSLTEVLKFHPSHV